MFQANIRNQSLRSEGIHLVDGWCLTRDPESADGPPPPNEPRHPQNRTGRPHSTPCGRLITAAFSHGVPLGDAQEGPHADLRLATSCGVESGAYI